MTPAYRIVPVEGENHEGHQWGYNIVKAGTPVLHVTTGGTGPCWNLSDPNDEGDDTLHVCELDELIGALTSLRDSDVYRANVERWDGWPT